MRSVILFLLPLACAAGPQTSGAKVEFEVASVKPAVRGPGSDGICRGGPGTPYPALFTCNYVDLKRIVLQAFGVRAFQLAAPDWTEDQRFDIRASLPKGATKEQFETMVQNLLADRFHLVFHREARVTTLYELLVADGGPKLKEAPKEEAPADGDATPAPPTRPDPQAMMETMRKLGVDKDGYPNLNTAGTRTVNGRSRFYEPHGHADSLLWMLERVLEKPVVDATGLKGIYEIELHWAGQAVIPPQMAAMMAQARANAGMAEGTAASDPGPAGPTIEQALRAQLGLKVELKKAPVDMVVIDRIDKVPTEN